jgi:pentatricopeptide repeat protein
VFNGLSVRDVVSWTALIAGYVEQGQPEEALNRLEEMQTRGITPNSVTYIFGLKACASLGAMEKGQEIHAEIERLGLLSLPENDLLGNAAVDMYAKCGALAMARKVFEALPVRCVASYNSLMSGYAHIGEAENALCVYEGMLGENIKPDSVSFVVILNACSQANLSEVSQVHFEAMEARYEVSPTIEHYTCMIDLLSRSGQLEKALSMIGDSPCCPDLVVWHTILGACKEWGNSELGRQAFLHALAST